MCVETGLSRKQMKDAFAAMANIGGVEMKKGRKFIVPGMARFVVKKKAARKYFTNSLLSLSIKIFVRSLFIGYTFL